jgi:eukaryotic-like serine/threonine-protein kinase
MDTQVRSGAAYGFGGFVLDPLRRTLAYDGAPIFLSATVFDTLLFLVEHPGRVVSKDELLDAVWPRKVVEEANVAQTIYTLRKALNVGGAPERMIVTAPGLGYRFALPVESVREGTPSPGAGGSAPRTAPVKMSPMTAPRRAAVIAGVAVLVALAIGGLAIWAGPHRPAAAAAGQKLVVLADFQNLSGAPVFDRTLTEATRIDLYQSPYVTVLPDRKVRDTLSLMTRPPDTPLTAPLAQEVCARNNAAAAVGGVIAQVGARYLLSLTAADCADGALLDAEKAEVASRDALLPALDRLVDHLRRRLGESADSVRRFRVPMLPARTGSLEALKAYSEGQYAFAHGASAQAKVLFEQAVQIDPAFAAAYVGLSAVYNNEHDFDRSQAYAAKAYALRDTVGARDRYHIIARYSENVSNDILEAIRNYQDWAAAYPQDNVPWSDLSNSENWIGRYAEAVAPGRRGLALAPANEAGYVVLARALLHDGQVDAAAAVCARAVAKGLAGADTHGLLTEIAAARGDDAAIARELASARGGPAERTVLIFAARNAWREGRARNGDALYARASALAREQGVVDFTLPFRARELADLGLGEQALRLLGEAPTSAQDDSDFVFATAELGDVARAQSLMERSLRRSPQDTLNNAVYAPETRAAIALRRGRPDAAIAALAPALPYEMRAFDTPYLRGRAYLAAGDGPHAAAEFRKILDHPDVEPTSPLRPLAQLGLARAWRLQGNRAQSRAAYAALLASWKNADADLPALVQASAEYAAL